MRNKIKELGSNLPKRKIADIENDLKDLFDDILKDKTSSSITEIIFYIFSELADNIKEHSLASRWQIDFSTEDDKSQIFIADNGIGIPSLFSKYFPQFKGDDWQKIIQALEKGLSTKGEGRGYGLKTIYRLVKVLSGTMLFISGGQGFLISQNKEIKRRFPRRGTIVLIQLPLSAKISKGKFYKILEDK